MNKNKPSERRESVVSAADSTHSGVSTLSAREMRQSQLSVKSKKSIFSWSDRRKTRQSYGAYTSLFPRKLLPPIGFYREVDKYNEYKVKFDNEPDKLEALEEMWYDYKKYQLRKRFRWPPNRFCKYFFWTTGYYADYQKKSRATRLRKPGEDSSDDEFMDPGGQFKITGENGEINLDEFDRYREAKKNQEHGSKDERRARFNEGGGRKKSIDKRATMSRLFDGNAKEVEEVETTVEVEYTLIKDPNSKKKGRRESISSSVAPGKAKLSEKEAAAVAAKLADPAGEKKLVTRKKSVVQTTTDETGKKTVEVRASQASLFGGSKKSKRKSNIGDDGAEDEQFIPVRHSIATLSTIWDTKNEKLTKQYSTHTLTVTNLPDKVGIKAMTQLFPGAKVNLKTPKNPGEQPYATVRFKDPAECKKYFLENRNVTLEGKNLIINPKAKNVPNLPEPKKG